MSWMTKALTLDLLAIAIDGMHKAFKRISEEQPAITNVQESDPETTHPADMPAEVPPAPAPAESAPPADPAALLVEAQNTLRLIAQKGGVEWITGTLFPHFNVQSLTEIPAERLPELIAMATERNAA